MTVEIDFDATGINDDRTGGWLDLHNPDEDVTYGSFPIHEDGDESDHVAGRPIWKWENPDDPVEDMTLHPSIKLDWEENGFHIFVRDGEIDHCGDCGCGCNP